MIDEKSQELLFVSPDETVFVALKLMDKFDIGALVVQERDKLVGIFSERDYARKVILLGKSSKDTLVSEIMTNKVMYVKPENTVEECMALMTKGELALPVLRELNS